MKVYVLEGVHPIVPGHVLKVIATKALADAEAASLVNILLETFELPQNADASNWENRLLIAQQKGAAAVGEEFDADTDGDEFGAVWINEVELMDDRPLPNLLVSMEGGMVSAVVSDQRERVAALLNAVVIVDYDTEGADEADIRVAPLLNGEEGAMALIHEESIEESEIDLAKLFERLDGDGAEEETVDGEAISS